jgi:hypothetical protein
MENTEFIKTEANHEAASKEISILRSFPSKDSMDGPKVQFSALDSLDPDFKEFFIGWIRHQIKISERRISEIPSPDDWVRREWIEWEINDYWGLHEEKWETGEIKNVRVIFNRDEL